MIKIIQVGASKRVEEVNIGDWLLLHRTHHTNGCIGDMGQSPKARSGKGGSFDAANMVFQILRMKQQF